MLDFTFHNPTKVLFGRGVSGKIADEICKSGIKSVLLHYGGSSVHKTGVYDQVTNALREKNISFCECGGVKPNPVLSKVREAAAIIRENSLEAVLAVGGGSVIDSAKAVALGAVNDCDVWDLFTRAAKPSAALPVFAVATVSATASEMNATSVVTNDELGHKMGITHELLFPRCTAIDPSLQNSVSERQTVSGGIDAICHVMETYFDGTKGAELQMEYCEGLIRQLMRLIPALRKNQTDYEARSQFAWAAVNALNGTTWAGHAGRGDFSSHAMGHSLSARYDSIHGETLAVLMPAWMKYVFTEDLDAFVRFADKIFGMKGSHKESVARDAINRMSKFFASVGAPVTLKEMNVPKEDLPSLAASVTRNGPIGVLKKLDTEDVLKIMESAYS